MKQSSSKSRNKRFEGNVILISCFSFLIRRIIALFGLELAYYYFLSLFLIPVFHVAPISYLMTPPHFTY